MSFDLIRFFDQQSIPYRTSGPNVSRGNVAIHCPFCGAADEGQHLSVSVDGKGWRCWRHPDHRGKSPVRLISALLGCPLDQAAAISNSGIHVPADFLGSMRAKLFPARATARAAAYELEMPDSFKPINSGLPSAEPYLAYLRGRGYGNFKMLARMFGLRYCTRGSYKGRIIFPIKQEGRLISWTGRTISRNQDLRYKSLSDDAEKAADEGMPPALDKLTNRLLWFDRLARERGRALILNEGPFDALAVNVVGWDRGIHATCCFTSSPSDAQVQLLHELAPAYPLCFILLDAAAQHVAMRLERQLSTLRFRRLMLPPQAKDPDAMRKHDLQRFLFASCEAAR